MSDKGGGQKVFWYSFGIHMGLSRGPLDEIVDVTVGDRRVYPLGGTKTIVNPDYTAGSGEGYGNSPPAESTGP